MDDKTHTRIELILKISGTLLIPVALALMGYFANRYLQSRQELETRACGLT